MTKIIKSLLILSMAFGFASPSNAEIWLNDTKTMFANNQAVVYAINIRSFNAYDKNGNDIIEVNNKENPGTFITAIKRLDELKTLGINTILLLPIMETGKIKASGTAGSLYAMKSFTDINPQFDDKGNKLTVEQEAKMFVQEAHKRDMKVLVDMPACGAYDLYLSNPGLFLTDKNNKPVVLSDWTDVRTFKVLNSDNTLNEEVLGLYRQFIKKVMDLGIDGVRANVASSKPYEFWRSLIEQAKRQDPEFLFIADVSDSLSKPVTNQTIVTPYDKLLDAGFDTYYGGYANYKSWKSGADIEKQILFNKKLFEKYSDEKSILAPFNNHDEVSPYAQGGRKACSNILWLNATLPVNALYVDGFPTGDTYNYRYANKKALATFTDDNIYFVHKGKFDIFNFSRKPYGHDIEFSKDFEMASKMKLLASEIITRGSFKALNTKNRSVLAYARYLNKSSIIIVWNKDNLERQKAVLKMQGMSGEVSLVPVKSENPPITSKNSIKVELLPGEMQIYLGNDLKF